MFVWLQLFQALMFAHLFHYQCLYVISQPSSIYKPHRKGFWSLLACLKRRHLGSDMLMLFQWTYSAFPDFIDPQKWILPLSSIRKSRKALDNGSALHDVPLEICSTSENGLDSVRPVKLLSTGWPWGWRGSCCANGGRVPREELICACQVGWLAWAPCYTEVGHLLELSCFGTSLYRVSVLGQRGLSKFELSS